MVLPEGQGGVDTLPSSDRTTYAPLNQNATDDEYTFAPTPPISGSSTPIPPPPTPPFSGAHPIYPSPRHPSQSIPLSPKLSTSTNQPSTKTPTPLDRSLSRTPLLDPPIHSPIHPPVILPPALHANFLTSCIGLATFVLMWPPLIALHWTGWEVFRWPAGEGVSSGTVWAGLAVVAWAGAFYVSSSGLQPEGERELTCQNAGLMVLIGIWGPTTSSVANLLTIGLVAVIDAVLMGLLPTLQTLIGVGMICAGFGILLWEGEE